MWGLEVSWFALRRGMLLVPQLHFGCSAELRRSLDASETFPVILCARPSHVACCCGACRKGCGPNILLFVCSGQVIGMLPHAVATGIEPWPVGQVPWHAKQAAMCTSRAISVAFSPTGGILHI